MPQIGQEESASSGQAYLPAVAVTGQAHLRVPGVMVSQVGLMEQHNRRLRSGADHGRRQIGLPTLSIIQTGRMQGRAALGKAHAPVTQYRQAGLRQRRDEVADIGPVVVIADNGRPASGIPADGS